MKRWGKKRFFLWYDQSWVIALKYILDENLGKKCKGNFFLFLKTWRDNKNLTKFTQFLLLFCLNVEMKGRGEPLKRQGQVIYAKIKFPRLSTDQLLQKSCSLRKVGKPR